MAYSLMSFIMEGRGKDGIKMMLEEEVPVQYKVNIPIVLLGGPVKAYYGELKSLIDAEIIVPEQARVGNAVGALVGKGIKRIEITIRPYSMENPDQNFLVFTPAGRKKIRAVQDCSGIFSKSWRRAHSGFDERLRASGKFNKDRYQHRVSCSSGMEADPDGDKNDVCRGLYPRFFNGLNYYIHPPQYVI